MDVLEEKIAVMKPDDYSGNTYSGFIITIIWYVVWFVYLTGMFDQFISYLCQLYYNIP